MAHVLRPARGMLLVKPIPEPSIQGGIHIPDNQLKDLKSQFMVVAVGKGRIRKFKKRKGFLLCFPEMKIGDRVVAGTYAGTELQINGVAHRLIEQDSVMALVGLVDSDPRLALEPVGDQPRPAFGN